jgi:predicted dehydrogenase
MNDLQLWSATPGRSGYIRIEAGPAHPPYGAFCPAPGHHLGFNDLKIIEVAGLLEAHAGLGATGPDFREAYEVQRTVEAMQRSDEERAWISL